MTQTKKSKRAPSARKSGSGKRLLCIHHACPRLGPPYSLECLDGKHWGVIAREGQWETQATGGYRDMQRNA